jgi:hypothetical protein
MRIKRLVRIVNRAWLDRTIASGKADGVNLGVILFIRLPSSNGYWNFTGRSKKHQVFS